MRFWSAKVPQKMVDIFTTGFVFRSCSADLKYILEDGRRSGVGAGRGIWINCWQIVLVLCRSAGPLLLFIPMCLNLDVHILLRLPAAASPVNTNIFTSLSLREDISNQCCVETWARDECVHRLPNVMQKVSELVLVYLSIIVWLMEIEAFINELLYLVDDKVLSFLLFSLFENVLLSQRQRHR